tara:strand:+ start:675 stop:956 length:282 start_codon:yes stop_codon:yes gene_type:complete
MDKEQFETYIDFGSSKIRIAVFDSEYPDNNFFIDKLSINNFSIKKFEISDSDNKINELIKDLEKKTNTHLNRINLMLDSPDFIIINISSKKKI